jgi:DNA-binding winged helix-turn-helix (wHTH) protein
VQVVTDAVGSTGHHHIRTAAGHDVVVQRRFVAGDGATVTTSAREAALLHRLVAAQGRTVGRSELLRGVWRAAHVDPSVLETTMGRLRRRLARTGLGVLTVNGRGYLLEGDVVPCPHRAPRGDTARALVPAG